jgi:hypothetical protein
MSNYHESKIVKMIGNPNGATTQFSTPTSFVSGTIRVIVNGQVYESDDDKWGWLEVNDNLVDFTSPPRLGDILEAFYQELSAVPGIGNVRGTPFDPSGALP